MAFTMYSIGRWRVPTLCVIAIWLLTHRYFGIQHDGYFYAVQALNHLQPSDFERDLFFVHGSQSDFTLFSPIYAWLIQAFGIDRSAFILSASAQLIWAIAAALIARQWLTNSFLVAGIALIFALPREYGSREIFHYAETFLTARLWAEALVLGCLAAALTKRQRLAWALAIVAFVVHPIIALPGILFLLAFHWIGHWRWLTLSAILCAAATFFLPRIDQAWLEMTQQRAPFVLLDQWQWNELTEPFTWIGILLAAAQAVKPARNAFLSLALAGGVGLAFAVVGSVNIAALLIQAQPWRCLWLLKVTALLALTALVMERWDRSTADRWLIAGFCAAALTANTLGGPVSLVLAYLAHALWRRPEPPRLPRWFGAAALVALGMVVIETTLGVLQQVLAVGDRLAAATRSAAPLPLGDLASFFDGPLALLLPVAAVFMVRLTPKRPKLALGSALVLCIAAACGWYRADEPMQNMLFNKDHPRPFEHQLAKDATVYWDGNFLYTWFLLRQSNYASIQQSVGVVFSEQTARETRRRLARLSAFGSADSDVAANETLIPAKKRQPRRIPQLNDLVRLCEDPVLDFVILPESIGPHTLPQWIDPLSGRSWYLHRCTDFSTAATA